MKNSRNLEAKIPWQFLFFGRIKNGDKGCYLDDVLFNT